MPVNINAVIADLTRHAQEMEQKYPGNWAAQQLRDEVAMLRQAQRDGVRPALRWEVNPALQTP